MKYSIKVYDKFEIDAFESHTRDTYKEAITLAKSIMELWIEEDYCMKMSSIDSETLIEVTADGKPTDYHVIVGLSIAQTH